MEDDSVGEGGARSSFGGDWFGGCDLVALLFLAIGAIGLYATAGQAELEIAHSPRDLRAMVVMLPADRSVDDVCRRYAVPPTLCRQSNVHGRRVSLLIGPDGDRRLVDSAKYKSSPER